MPNAVGGGAHFDDRQIEALLIRRHVLGWNNLPLMLTPPPSTIAKTLKIAPAQNRTEPCHER